MDQYSVTLEEAKKCLRVENNEEDSLISGYINAAEALVKRMTGKETIDSYDLQAAIMLIVCGLYENRNSHEEARKVVLNPVLQMILQSARVDDSCI